MDEILTIRATFSFILAAPVICAWPRQSAFELPLSMKLDLFTDGGIVLADRLSDGGLGRTVPDASFNDPPLLGREMRDVFIGIHEKTFLSRRHCQGSKLYRSVRLISMPVKLDSHVRLTSRC